MTCRNGWRISDICKLPSGSEAHDERYPFAESDLRRLEDEETVVVVPEGWIRGQLSWLADVRGALDHALEKLT